MMSVCLPDLERVRVMQASILNWYRHHGRHNLPWQHPRTPYRVWISEIMLQQTQVQTVLPYFDTFMHRFPTIESLAAANLDEILSLWSGLGYYARARHLHRAAKEIVERFHGELPKQIDLLMSLPGIGRNTAAAIVAQAWDLPEAILDGNVKRVLCRLHRVAGPPNHKQVESTLWHLAETYTPELEVAAYTQAIMDFGATLCRRMQPRCAQCPLQSQCEAYQMNQTALFPNKMQRNARSRQFASFLMVQDRDNRIWLERRTGSGIWGGLFCFPEWDICESINDWTLAQFGARVATLEHWPQRLHRFTHFDLAYDPVKVTLDQTELAAELLPHASGQWMAPEMNTLPGGVATPIRQLIEELIEA